MRMEILLVLQSYVMLQPTWTALRWAFHVLMSPMFQNEGIWVLIILSGRKVQQKKLPYSWQHCILCWTGRNLRTSSSVHAGVSTLYSCLSFFALIFLSDFVMQVVDWLLNFLFFNDQQAASLEEAISVININRYIGSFKCRFTFRCCVACASNSVRAVFLGMLSYSLLFQNTLKSQMMALPLFVCQCNLWETVVSSFSFFSIMFFVFSKFWYVIATFSLVVVSYVAIP